jgi:2'-5' RNA ligase
VTTIGVAVAVPEPWATQLQDYRESLGDETASTIPTHITLMPPVDVDESLLPAIEQHLAEASANNHVFRIHLRGTGTFRPVSPVVFVGVVEGISECEQLAYSVRRGPLAIDAEFPYHPHVTIAHHQPDESLDRAFKDLASFECEFEVEDFRLYAHDDRIGWIPRRDFPLTAAADL